MNTIRVIENRTNMILVEESGLTMGMLFGRVETLRNKWNNRVDGGCTIKGYYTAPERITEDTKAVINNKTWDCM